MILCLVGSRIRCVVHHIATGISVQCNFHLAEGRTGVVKLAIWSYELGSTVRWSEIISLILSV